ESLAGARLAHERDQFHPVVEERVEGEVLLAVARLDAPNPLADVDNGNELLSRRVHFGEDGSLGIGRFREGAVFVGEISFAAVELELAVGAEGCRFFGSYYHLEVAGV